MFGMLDYRAHKLLWLLCLPLRLLVRLSVFANVAASVFIAQSTSYPLLVKCVIGCVAFEAIGVVILLVWQLVYWIVQQMFFWLIDVVPSDGENAAEAREVVIRGKFIRLGKKFLAHIDDWTTDDTREFVSGVCNWRTRLLFNVRERMEKRVAILKRYQNETGKQPQDMRGTELQKLVGHFEMNWFERLISNQVFFNSMVGGCIIIAALVFLNR